MIVTVTPNPSLDFTLEIRGLVPGSVQRADATRMEAGGKGVNVARALVANGYATCAVLPIGGPEGDHLAALLDTLGVETCPVPVAAPIRTNVSLIEPDGRVTKINTAGPHLTDDESRALEKTTVASLDGAAWVVASGSLPPGAPADLYARLIRDVHDAGVPIAVDASGEPLAKAITAAPDVIKPNLQELAGVVGRDLSTFGEVVVAARELVERGARALLVSLGGDGALLVDESGVVHAESPPVTPLSNVGAGDATLGGFLAAGGAGREALRQAVAWGAAAVRLPGSAMPGAGDVDLAAIELKESDPDRRLVESGGSL